jgi:aminoglycoside phosphotransferase (APT) family kinase protein
VDGAVTSRHPGEGIRSSVRVREPAIGTVGGVSTPETTPAAPDAVPGVDVAAVTNWFESSIDGAHGPFRFDVIAGGHSNLTYRVTGANGARYVLRRPPLGHRLASAHDMGREHRIVHALQHSAVPVAPALGYCADPAVNDAPFYVMGFVDGHVIRDRAAAEAVLSPAARRHAGESIVDTMAAIHAVDLDTVGLADLGKHEGYIARQLKRWYGQWNAQKTRELTAVDTVHDELLRRIPEQGPATIVHGDYRLDNCMVGDDGTVVAVLDWEICTLGDPLADVGLLQVYWTGPDDDASAWTGSATTAPGFPNRAELAERYAAASGRDLSQLPFYVSFAYWKLACILEGVYARYLGGALGQRDPAELEPFKLQVDGAAAKALATLESLG